MVYGVGFVPGISRDGNSREITDFPGKIPGNKKLTGFPGNFPGNSRDFVAFPVSRFPGNEKSGKFQTLISRNHFHLCCFGWVQYISFFNWYVLYMWVRLELLRIVILHSGSFLQDKNLLQLISVTLGFASGTTV